MKKICLGLATSLALAAAQTITPANLTTSIPDSEAGDVAVQLTLTKAGDEVSSSPVLGLTSPARQDTTPAGQSGPALLVSPSSDASRPQPDQIALISCDPSPGFLGPTQTFQEAEGNGVAAILFYSTQADYCKLEDYAGGYRWIYSMKNRSETSQTLQALDHGSGETTIATINQAGFKVVNGTGAGGPQNGASQASNHDGNANDNSPDFGPASTTAVAMIVLYSITGVITALFLIIIVTGAVRAHRHPERYGPRNIIGRPRQSRARGVARAMLDTLPIVKFGEREAPKPVDTELGDNVTSDRRSTGTSEQTQQDMDDAAPPPAADEGRQSVEGGIAAATAHPDQGNPDHQGCSICTEDFETGQDQRVLPCDHRFHPACVDPWLLNVSGTCPLCRVDLQPATSSTTGTGGLDENGNPVLREGEFEPPPLGPQDTAGDRQRMTIRRSIMLGIMGFGRPDRMTREERMFALRQLREQQLARERREREAAVEETPEEERRTRRRLRDVLRRRPTRPAEPANQSELSDTNADAEVPPSSERQDQGS